MDGALLGGMATPSSHIYGGRAPRRDGRWRFSNGLCQQVLSRSGGQGQSLQPHELDCRCVAGNLHLVRPGAPAQWITTGGAWQARFNQYMRCVSWRWASHPAPAAQHKEQKAVSRQRSAAGQLASYVGGVSQKKAGRLGHTSHPVGQALFLMMWSNSARRPRSW
jgi:hypothetical protein